MSEGELTARASARDQLAGYVDLSEFPRPAGWLVEEARSRQAPPEVLARLAELDPHLELLDEAALWAALGYEDHERL
jgi:hypothetical protein